MKKSDNRARFGAEGRVARRQFQRRFLRRIKDFFHATQNDKVRLGPCRRVAQSRQVAQGQALREILLRRKSTDETKVPARKARPRMVPIARK